MRADPKPSPSGPVNPWYRERWPWLLFAGPALAVVAGFVTLWLAVASDDGVIADDYYRRGLLINRELERTRKAEMMGLGAVLDVAANGTLRLDLVGVQSGAPAPPRLRVRFAHATRAGFDRAATLARGPDGHYVASIAPLPPGRWLIGVETDEWRLPTVEAGAASGEVRFGTARGAR
jgi:hypothetical protein